MLRTVYLVVGCLEFGGPAGGCGVEGGAGELLLNAGASNRAYLPPSSSPWTRMTRAFEAAVVSAIASCMVTENLL